MSLLRGFTNLFRSRELEQEFDDEIRFHLDARADRNLHEGMTEDAARADARRRFGSVNGAKQGMREARMNWRKAVGVIAVDSRSAAGTAIVLTPRAFAVGLSLSVVAVGLMCVVFWAMVLVP